MTFRGVYRDGVVYLEASSGLRNGEIVKVLGASRRAPMTQTPKTTRQRKPSTKRGDRKHPLPGFGAWKRRNDIADTAAFARTLRRRVSARRSPA